MRSNRTLKFFRSYIKSASDLSGKERTVILKRLRRVSLEQIGKVFKVTEGRIRQIEKVAIKKLKSKARQLNLFKK
jgi:DNA-directed RNA polymerase sigma subunit (sigma70/sigma32)